MFENADWWLEQVAVVDRYRGRESRSSRDVNVARGGFGLLVHVRPSSALKTIC